MAKKAQVLAINPTHDLVFQCPFNVAAVYSVIRLTNPTDREICFKIKTTVQKDCVARPNQGLIQPRKTVEVTVSLLLSSTFDPLQRNPYKIMVQSMHLPLGEIIQEALWKKVDPNQVMESKLACVFVRVPTNSAALSEASKKENQNKQNEPGVNKAKSKAPKGEELAKLRRIHSQISSKEKQVITFEEKRLQLLQDIAQLKADPSYISPQELEMLLLPEKPRNSASFGSQLSCPVCTETPIEVFRCEECSGWICQTCKDQFLNCTVCRVDFSVRPPRRDREI